MRLFFIIFALLALLEHGNLSAQKSENAKPFSSIYKLSPVTEFEEMPIFSKTLLLREDEERRAKRLKEYRFAHMFTVGFHPFNSGTWNETGAGKVWRLGIHSKDAYSLYLVFNEFKLVPGVKIFVYNAGFTSIAGAFTSNNNNRFNKLAVTPIDGDAIIIEMDIPSGIDNFGKLSLGKVGHDYINEFGADKLKSAKIGPSQDCEVDINCPTGQDWQKDKRAVCKLIVGGELCTGTLINNVDTLKIPYLITAYHCIENDSAAQEGIFFFNYERVSCGGIVETSEQTLSGAELVSTTNNKLDFALLKLNEYPPLVYKPFFVGWDARPDQPTNGYCIHHPEGDVKKISVDNHPLITDNFGEGFDTMSHWKVLRWDVGATEGGSSGSPIFNNQHRLFGTLTGGSANCTDPVNDYYTKFSLSWDKYPDTVNQLKYWLDPGKRGNLFINGFDPYNVNLGVCDTFWNISQNESIALSNDNLNWGWISGQNSGGANQFAEKFTNKDSINIPGVFLNVAKAYSSNPFSTITIKIWKGDAYPTTEIYSKQVYIKKFSENAINFIGFDTIIVTAGNFFIGYEVNYDSPSDTFAVYHAANRGVNGVSTMYVHDNGSWRNVDSVSSPALYTSLSIGLVGCDGVNPYKVTLTCDTFWNIPKKEFITSTKSNLKWGWISGHNSSGASQFAEKFLNKGTIRIPGIFFYVAKAYNANPFSTIKIKIWESNSYPSTEIFSKQLYIKRFKEDAINFVGFENYITAPGDFFVGYEINYNTPSDTFALYEAASRGVNGPSTMYVYNSGSWQSVDAISSPALYTSLSVGIMGCGGHIDAPQRKEIHVYPNPFSEEAQLDLPEGVTITNVLVHNYTGQNVFMKYQISDNKLFLSRGFLPSGMYILELRTKSAPMFGKFTIIRK